MSASLNPLALLAPQLIVALTGAVILIADMIEPRSGRPGNGAPILGYLGIAGLAVAAMIAALQLGTRARLFGGAVLIDPLTSFFDLLFIGVGIVVLMLAMDALPRFSRWSAEFYALVLWCTAGNMLVAPAGELFTLFVCLQLTSLPLIVLIGFGKLDARSREAALKYLMVVLVATAVLLYGISLVYGSLGTSSIARIGQLLGERPLPGLAAIGLVLMLAGFGFKITAAPFQQWVPDVYEGAPTPVTAFLSVGSKLTGFAIMLRFVVTGLNAAPKLHLVFATLAVASMLVGNLGALEQSNIKRLLAYSGIAQAGYILVGLSAMSATGVSALLFYLVAYGVANLLAFGVVIAVADAIGGEDVSDYAGLVGRSPVAAFALTVALLSLAGLPLTAGFMAKFYVFLAAAKAGLFWLVVIAVVNAVVAFYYYLRIVWMLYVAEGESRPLALPSRLTGVMVAGTFGVVVIGLFPATLLAAATHASKALFGL